MHHFNVVTFALALWERWRAVALATAAVTLAIWSIWQPAHAASWVFKQKHAIAHTHEVVFDVLCRLRVATQRPDYQVQWSVPLVPEDHRRDTAERLPTFHVQTI